MLQTSGQSPGSALGIPKLTCCMTLAETYALSEPHLLIWTMGVMGKRFVCRDSPQRQDHPLQSLPGGQDQQS